MASVVLVTAVWAGAGALGQQAVGSTVTSVTLWVHPGQQVENDAVVASVRRFNLAHPDIHLELVQFPGRSYVSQVNAAAFVNQLPCLLEFDGPNLYNYVWSGKLQALDRYVDAATRQDFLPSILRQGTFQGRLYSLGQYESGLALWGNKKVLERAKVRIPTRLDTAWNASQLEGVLAALKKRGLRYPLDMKFNYGQSEWFTYGFAPIMQSFGGEFISKDLKTAQEALNGAAAVRGMTYFQTLTQRYVNTKTRSDLDFVQGRAALSYVGHWTYPDYKKALGKDLVLIPMPRFGKVAVTGSGSWSLALSSNCSNPDAAARALRFLVSRDEVLAMSKANGAVPSRRSAIARSALFGKGQPLHLYVDQLERIARPRPATPAYPAITQAFAQAIAHIAAGKDVQNELNRAARAIDADLLEHKGYPSK